MIEYTRATEITTKEAEEIFTYKPWNGIQMEVGKNVREDLQKAFETIVNYIPPCAFRTRALNKLIDARMLANAAITFEEGCRL